MKRLIQAVALASTLGSLSYVASADVEKGAKHEKGERAMQRVYFDFDSATPKQDLLMVANQLACNPGETVILDAYTDPVGTEDYNADLALRRARAVRDELVELGIAENRIMLGIFGEQGMPRDRHDLDRRVEIRTSDEPVATLEQRRQATAIAVVGPGESLEEVAIP